MKPCWQKPCWQIYMHGLHGYVGASARVASLRRMHAKGARPGTDEHAYA